MADELPINIIDVWDRNLVDEVNRMRIAINEYPYVAMDTEFPGKFYHASNSDGTRGTAFEYKNLKANVDHLKIIQIGITLFDEEGNLPTFNGECPVWQFNFCEFNVNTDSYAQDSIDLLRNAGIELERNLKEGIAAVRFAELLMSSGLVLNENTHWVTFHGGYDCGYWIRLLTNKHLPDTEAGFYDLVKKFFPVIYDLKHVAACTGRHGGLVTLSRSLGIERNAGSSHQAGSDSFLTFRFYRELKKVFVEGSPMNHAGVLDLR